MPGTRRIARRRRNREARAVRDDALEGDEAIRLCPLDDRGVRVEQGFEGLMEDDQLLGERLEAQYWQDTTRHTRRQLSRRPRLFGLVAVIDQEHGDVRLPEQTLRQRGGRHAPARGDHGLGRRRAGQDPRELSDGPSVKDGFGDVVRVHRRIAALGKESCVDDGVGDRPVTQQRVAVLIQYRDGVEVHLQNFQKWCFVSNAASSRPNAAASDRFTARYARASVGPRADMSTGSRSR